MDCCARNLENIASAAASVGSSRFAAGVPVRDLDRLVDFPKDPVSGTTRRALKTVGLPSVLGSTKSGGALRSSKFDIAQSLLLNLRKHHCIWADHSILACIQFLVWYIVEN